jgi:hypothetical protein
MSRCIIGGTWDRAPHLSQAAKDRLYDSIEPYQRAARSLGIPQLGSGAIYPILEDAIKVDPFTIPRHWPRGLGQDVGWNYTAVVWGAKNPDTGTCYVYSVYKGQKEEPSAHVAAHRNRGLWIPGRIDPASRGKSQRDGVAVIDDYKSLGVPLEIAVNAVNAGIGICYRGLKEGQIKVFRSCQEFFDEYRTYIRDELGRVVKTNDHVLDAFRYLFAGGTDWWQPTPARIPDPRPDIDLDLDTDESGMPYYRRTGSGSQSWMA